MKKNDYINMATEEINNIFQTDCILIEETDRMLINVEKRRIYKKAPCHHLNKDSSADALIIESIISFKDKLNKNDIIYFISENKADFSDPENSEFLHKDILI